jgi:hypothetical protein
MASGALAGARLPAHARNHVHGDDDERADEREHAGAGERGRAGDIALAGRLVDLDFVAAERTSEQRVRDANEGTCRR